VAVIASSVALARDLVRPPAPDPAVLSSGRSVFVSPSGGPDGDGTAARPLDLATALSATGPVRPGTYRGVFRSDLAGTPQQPIVVRPYPGEHPAIDSAPFPKPALTVYGAWTTYRDFEVFDSNPTRESSQADSSQPSDLPRGPGFEVHGPHTALVNLVVHDLSGGLDIWSDAIDAEAYGNVIYDNGWKAGEKNNGHGIYTQNHDGTRLITNNIIFNQFGTGIHAYGSDQAFLDNIRLEGNVVFNNGVLGGKYDRNILVGGGREAHHPMLLGNHTFFSSGRGFKYGQNNVGYLAGCTDLEVRNNHFTAAEFGFSLEIVNCTGTIEKNTFYGEIREVDGSTLVNDPTLRRRFPANVYVDHMPEKPEVYVEPNRYTAGRANIIIYNWSHQDEVEVDVSTAALAPGAAYEILDAQNVLGDPIASGVYDGTPVAVPMTGLSAAEPIGDGLKTPPHSAPEFGVFIVRPAAPATSLVARAVAAIRRFL
jgi:hypothetical protein